MWDLMLPNQHQDMKENSKLSAQHAYKTPSPTLHFEIEVLLGLSSEVPRDASIVGRVPCLRRVDNQLPSSVEDHDPIPELFRSHLYVVLVPCDLGRRDGIRGTEQLRRSVADYLGAYRDGVRNVPLDVAVFVDESRRHWSMQWTRLTLRLK